MADLVTYDFSPPLDLDNHNVFLVWAAPYRIAGKFGESSVIRQTKTIQIFTYNYYLMAESIHSPNFSSPNTHNSEIRQTFSSPNFPGIRYNAVSVSV